MYKSHDSEAILLSKMKLLHFPYTFVLLLGHIQVIYGNCDAANNNAGVLERAFGPVIATRLQGQLEEIRASFKSGLDKQSGQLEEIIDGRNVESQEFMNQRFDKLGEDLIEVSNKIGDERNAMEQVMKANLEDQSDTIKTSVISRLDEQNGKLELLEDFEQNMESKFEEQKEQFEVLLLKQKEDFEQKLIGLQEKFNDILTAVALNSDFLACPTDWVRVIDSCIWVSNEKATFDNATEKCKELDSAASLYEPPNKHHSELVFNLLKTERSHWIGIHDRFEEDAWIYLSTNETISFTNWQKDRPDNHNGNEDCVEFGGSFSVEKEKLWNDLNCDNKEKFICEKKLLK